MNISNLSLENQNTLCSIIDGGQLQRDSFNQLNGLVQLDNEDGYNTYTTHPEPWKWGKQLKYNLSLDWIFRLIVKLNSLEIPVEDIKIKLLRTASATTIQTSTGGMFRPPHEDNSINILRVLDISNDLFHSLMITLNQFQTKIENIIGMTIGDLNNLLNKTNSNE